MDDQRHQLTEQFPAIAQLWSVDTAIPGRPTVHDLIAQGVDAIEQHREYIGSIALCQSGLCSASAVGETFASLLLGDLAVLVIPEALENVWVIQQHADASGKLGPDQFLYLPLAIQIAKFAQKGTEGFLFG